MKILIVEDDFTSRLLLQELLKDFGTPHIAVNGDEALAAVRNSLECNEPYDLICLDIMMPEMDGQTALRKIRALEEDRGLLHPAGTKIIMTTALDDPRDVMAAFYELCDAYIFKPIEKAKLMAELSKLGLTPVR